MDLLLLLPTLLLTLWVGRSEGAYGEESALSWANSIEDEVGEWCNRVTEAAWLAGINITDETRKNNMDESILYAAYKKGVWQKVKTWPWKRFENATLRRQFKIMSNIGPGALSEKDIILYTNVTAEMQNIYGTAKVPDYKDPDLLNALTPGLDKILRESWDWDELEHTWTGWRAASGAKMFKIYPIYVDLEGKSAQLNGYADAADGWTSHYESATFREDVWRIWRQVEPLYKQLHAYVRRALIEHYPGKLADDGLIPEHILGNMWGE
jgi:hypothetical protein